MSNDAVTRSPNPRSVAVAVLEQVARRQAYADAALDAHLRRHPSMPPRDRALAAQLVYGVLRWQNRLDAHLARASSRPLGKIHPTVLTILRLAAYQILLLDRIPTRAAVHEAVEETRRRRLGHASGFVNAVLRSLARQGPDLPLPEAPAERLALRFGCPTWIVERWLDEWGEAGAERLCRAASRGPETWLRVWGDRAEALDRLRAEGVEAGPGRYAPQAVWVRFQGQPRDLPLVREGRAVVQDQASQLVADVLAPRPGWRVLDACAAPGLKTLQIAERVGQGGRVLALDLHPHRARGVGELVRGLGLPNVGVVAADAASPPAAREFDAVLVDAPCSGLGVLSRTPEAKWRRTAEKVEDLPGLQARILRGVADLVRPGGILVYATCTTLRAENEGVIGAFLADRSDFRVDPPPAGDAPWARFVTAEGFLRTFPEGVGEPGPQALDGFFAARLRRTGGEHR